jgi:hypothetical protein
MTLAGFYNSPFDIQILENNLKICPYKASDRFYKNYVSNSGKTGQAELKDENYSDKITVYPIPFSDILNVKLLPTKSVYKLKVFDVMGRKVYENIILIEIETSVHQ